MRLVSPKTLSIVLFILSFSLSGSAQTGRKTFPLPSKTFALQQLRNAQQKIKSVQFIYHYTAQLTSAVPQTSTASATTTTYEFAFSSKGDRCYLKSLHDSLGSGQENMVSLFDSRRNYQIATVKFHGKTVNDCTFLCQNMGMALTPMDFGYFLGSLHWAAEALQPTTLAVHGYENSSFGPVLKVMARDQNGFTDTLYLAPNYDYLIAKWEIHAENGEIVEFICDKAIQKKASGFYRRHPQLVHTFPTGATVVCCL